MMFFERRWNACKSCEEYPTNSWNGVSVCRLFKVFQKDSSIDKRTVSGRKQAIITKEYKNLIENGMCSQEDNSGSYMLLREVDKNTSISRKSAREMIKITALNKLRHLETTMMGSGTKKKNWSLGG